MALLTVSILSMLEKISGNIIEDVFLILLIRDALPDISMPLASCACLILVNSPCTSGIYLRAMEKAYPTL
jgi:hypothetical protein